MKQVLKYLESRTKEVNSNHPLLRDWLDNDAVEADKKFLFTPMALDFVMEFRYFCRYYAKFDEPDDELQRLLNIHLEEDETHSGMYLDDWEVARVSDSLVGWSPRDLLWWLTSAHTAHVRRANLELTRLAYANPDPLLRFCIIETLEAIFRLVLPRTVEITRRASAPASHYTYWGEKHMALEFSHAQQADETLLLEARMSPSQEQRAIHLVARTCDLWEFQGVEWTRHAQAVYNGTWNFHPAEEARAEGAGMRPPMAANLNAVLTASMDLSYPPYGQQREASAAAAAAALRQQAFDELWQAPFNVWVRDAAAWGGDFRGMLRRHILLPWILEFWAMADFWQVDATYPDPSTPLERGINRVSELYAAQYSKRRYAEWELLGMDDFTGWSLSQALRYFRLDEGVDKRRAILVTLRKLTYRFPQPLHRYWIVKCVAGFRDALVRSLGAAMDSAGVRAEEEDNFVLFAGHAERLHPELPPDPEADEAIAALERQPLSEIDAAVICDHIIPALKQQEMERLQLSFESVTNQRGKLKVVREYAGAAPPLPAAVAVAAMASTSPSAGARRGHGGRALAKTFRCRASGTVMSCNLQRGSTWWVIPGRLQPVNGAAAGTMLPAHYHLPLLSLCS